MSDTQAQPPPAVTAAPSADPALIARTIRDVTALRSVLVEGGAADNGDLVAALDGRVLRPLAAFAAQAEPATSAATEAEDHMRSETALRPLVITVTRRLGAAREHRIVEAVAGLQALALVTAADADERRSLLAELIALMPPGQPIVAVSANGPYLVTGALTLTDHLGLPIAHPPVSALCRCGASASKPFCDGSHAVTGFTGGKADDRVPDRRDRHAGTGVVVLDNRGLCAHSGLCTARVPTAFHAGSEPFATPNGARVDELLGAARRCPSGALSIAFGAVEARSAVDQDRPAEIVVSRNGPCWIRGGVEVRDEHDEPVARNQGASLEHGALCRCGQSQNTPFCSGMHCTTGFTDPPPPDEPTIFEWAGGMPALLAMTERFYSVYIPEDDLLRPVFLGMSPDHPRRVAAWLAEVFGGPTIYSEQHGGYAHMLSQHLGRALNEQLRRRWVQLLLRSADDVGLPNDAEFRAAFTSYIEWGTRLAVENSQPGAAPPQRMPMPRWTWTTGPGAPWGRVSALAAPEPEHAVTLPAPDEAPSFDRHIKALFRTRDRDSMKWAFDLWEVDDVRQHADHILARIEEGTMPCDGAWDDRYVSAFRRWIAEGKPA